MQTQIVGGPGNPVVINYEYRDDAKQEFVFNFSLPVFLYFFLPDDHGLYPCFRMWLICLFMVRKNKAKKYNKRMGQNTGTSKILKRERKMEMATALAAERLAERKWVEGKKNVT
jgi:hypothetical protein